MAFNQSTEPPGCSQLLDETRPGAFVDAVSGVRLFRNGAKFNSGTGWPSFFAPAVILKPDQSTGIKRTEVISASSGIHLGQVFADGPLPTGQRFCINGTVLRFSIRFTTFGKST